MTTTDILARYQNGNCMVQIHSDGTKVREWDGDARPELPESMDLKITDWCDGGCLYCHEKSTVEGNHSRLEDIQRLLSDLPAGVEIATGGGDTMAYPQLEEYLVWCKERGLIVNMTVNAMHLYRHAETIQSFRERKLVYGIGISYGRKFEEKIDQVTDDRTVLHVIAGVDDVGRIMRLCRHKPRTVLVLGYKRFGRGVIYFDDSVERNLGAWRYWIGTMMRSGSRISFDNLAIEQLGIQGRVTTDVWDRYYLGQDGSHTMYIDAVRMEYAKSSVSKRETIDGHGIRELFDRVQVQV